jgi:galactose oxidase
MRSNPNAVRLPMVLLALSLVVTACTGPQPVGPTPPAAGTSTVVHPPGHVAPPAEVFADAASTPLPRTDWTAVASDQDARSGDGSAASVLDGDLVTDWISRSGSEPAALPHSITVDMHTTQRVAALRYTPPNSSDGRIGRFEIHVSTDGSTWGTPVASGTWADDSLEKIAQFAGVPARFVRLTAITEAGDRGPWSAAAELNLFGEATTTPAAAAPAAVTPPPAVLPRTGWTITASDQETAKENGRVSRLIDGSTSTIWHSQYSPTVKPLPHWVQVDLGTTQELSGLKYFPRQGTKRGGNIGRYSITVSTNGTTWSAPVATGTWADTTTEKTVAFPPVQARYLRLTAHTEAANRGPWSSGSELNLIGRTLSQPPAEQPPAEQPPAPPATPAGTLPRTGWTITASDQETAKENGRVSRLIDGSSSTIWHSQYSPTVKALPHWVQVDLGTTQELSGLKYLPRQGTKRGGNIGRYSITVSTSGTTWSAPVATGIWADTTAEKSVTFAPVQARYLRLTATTEAANRGPWSSGAELNLIGRTLSQPPAEEPPAEQPPTDPQPAPSKGAWGSTITFPLVPSTAALLPGNKLLTWSANIAYDYGGDNRRTQTAILDLNTGVVTPLTVSNTMHDMFCPGVSILPDGRVLVTGGSNAAKSSIYDPVKNTWTVAAPMKIPRGYQSNVTLSTGEVFTIGGSWSGGRGGKIGEVWSEASGWRTLPNAPVEPILTADKAGVFRSDNHAWLFAAPGGKVFQAGPSKRMNWYTTTGTGGVQSAGLRGDSGDAMNGNAVMYDVGRILTMGGAPHYDTADATARAYEIDIRDGVKVTRTGDMAFRRAFSNGVVLPDGQVLVVGGQAYARPFTDQAAAMAPELWNPDTGKFTALAPMSIARTYHSVALLLPDARVFVGGGGQCGECSTNHPNGQIFTPPYLLNADGTARPRPTITSAPASAKLGASIEVTTSGPAPKFSLVRTSSVTHTINTDQRRIPLTPTSMSGNTATLAVPSDPGVVVPGTYLLFALDANGVPSVAKTIQIG